MNEIAMPADWAREVLRALQQYDPQAHIAGGYLRDLDNGREPKDVDIFLSVAFLTTITNEMGRLGFFAEDYKGGEYFTFDPTIRDATMFKQPEGYLPVNIIRLEKPTSAEDNMARFDFGLCRIAFDNEFLIMSPDYLRDTKNEQFVLRRCENEGQYQRSVWDRYERLRQKYDWPLVVPEEFKKFEPHVESFDGLADL